MNLSRTNIFAFAVAIICIAGYMHNVRAQQSEKVRGKVTRLIDLFEKDMLVDLSSIGKKTNVKVIRAEDLESLTKQKDEAIKSYESQLSQGKNPSIPNLIMPWKVAEVGENFVYLVPVFEVPFYEKNTAIALNESAIEYVKW